MKEKETHCDVEMMGRVEVKLKVLNQKKIKQRNKKDVMSFKRKETHCDMEMREQIEVNLNILN